MPRTIKIGKSQENGFGRAYTYMRKGLRLLFVILLVMFSLSLQAQNMSIASFKMDEADQTANVSPTMRLDINGEKCALIKIATTQKNFSFDVGSLGITHTEWQNSEHPGEIWLYVPNGVMKITIQHPQFGSIKDYDLKGRLKKGRTYVMNLTSDQVNTLVVDYENSQVLEVDVFPHDADLYINGLKQSLDFNGRASITLPFGTHNYRVVAKNYHSEESQVVINDKENKQNLSIRLKQAFGYLNVSIPKIQGGDVFVDDRHIGGLPITNFPLKSAPHKLAILHKLYKPYTENVSMADSVSVSVSPTLQPNYSEYEIYVDGDNDAQIYDNGELLGTGHWKGRLGAGQHIIEAKKENHTATSQEINVVADTPHRVSIAKPIPIYGTLEIRTTPSNAEVYIDYNSKVAGVTDFIDSKLLIGPHHIKVTLAGHKTEEFDVDIKEGQTERINRNLTDYCNFTITSSPTAHISIDDIDEGLTPKHLNLVAGTYRVTLSADGYSSFSKKLRLNSKTKDMTIKLHRNFIRPNEFYFQFGCSYNLHAGFNVKGFTAFNAGMGGYVRNINFEVNVFEGLPTNDKITWNDKYGISHPFTATYQSLGGNVKCGYGFKLHGRIRLPPQVGYQYIQLAEESSKEAVADKSKSMSLTLGVRCNFAISKKFGISVSPEYLIDCFSSNGFKALSNVSPSIRNMANGFNCNVNLVFN